MNLLAILKNNQKKHGFPILLIIIIFFILILYNTIPISNKARIKRDCLRYNDNYNRENVLTNILDGDKKPKGNKNIFFHETSCSTDGVIMLNARQACAIESAAKMNPDWQVFVLFASRVGFNNKTRLPLIDELSSYRNIHFRHVNIETYAENTPLDEWVLNGDVFESKFVNSHLSDVFRYLSLWKYGGTYLDLDVIVKKGFNILKPNYAGAESEKAVAAGVLNFDDKNFGHQIADMCIREILVHFNGADWGSNGPGVITRVLKKVCNTALPLQMTRDRCHSFRVFSPKAFYAIHFKEFRYFFEERHLDNTIKLLNDSIVVHVWNKFSQTFKVKVGSRVAYGVLADQYCPKVYHNCGEYF